MYQVLRGESLKAVLPRIIVCWVLAAVLLGVGAPGLVKMAAGPKDLDSVPREERIGKYVSFDASEVIVAFATLTSSSDSGSKTLETYYLLPAGENCYMAVLDRREHHDDVLKKAMEQSHAYYMEDLGTLTPLGPLSGTVTKLGSDMPSYMADCIDNYQLPGYEEGKSSLGLIVEQQVVLDRVGFLPGSVSAVLGILGLVCLLLGLLQLVLVLSGFYERKVKACVGDVADEDFAAMEKIERVRVGEYILYPQGAGDLALKTEDLVWGYPMPEPLVVSKYRWPVSLYDRDQNLTRISFMDQRSCQKFLDAVKTRGGCFRVGYTPKAAEQFQNDFPAFLRDTELMEKEG